jgi:hypothetical protein
MRTTWVDPEKAGRLALCCLALGALTALAACGPRGGPSGAQAARTSPSAPGAKHDWRDATYTLTCDGLSPGGFQAQLYDGTAQVPADAGQTPYYDYFDVSFEAAAGGDVDGDGRPDTVVLLACSPQPSNGTVEEAQVFAANGNRIGVLPSATTLPEATMLPPLYDPAGLSVADGDIVAVMRVYGPDDSHASGPSQRITVRWHWDGQGFTRVT